MAQQQISKPRGTIDMMGDDYARYLRCVRLLAGLASEYGFRPIQIPAFEESGLFLRSVGKSSDIVRKETFDLVNKGSAKDYTLRPEFTAGIVRAIIENKVYASPDTPLRFSYWGPVYRYERPGTGRLREFRQFGVECFDTKLDFNAQAECLELSYRGAKAVLQSDGLRLVLNYLGGSEARVKYRKALVEYFSSQIAEMCDDCKERLKLNPLRILDCKVEADHARVAGAPKIEDYLTEEDKAEFASICHVLDGLAIPYRVDDRLVRGLDYYTGTVFELEDGNAPQFGAVGGGGKYAGLMSQLGGPEMEGMGFSFGIDRLLGAAGGKFSVEPANIDCFVVACAKTEECRLKASLSAAKLRDLGLSAVLPSLSKSIGGAFKMADRLKADYAVLVNEDLSYELKDLKQRTQNHYADFEALVEALKEGK